MKHGILGQKIGMAQLFDPESGSVIPVTYLYCPPNDILQVKSLETDDTEALVLGYAPLKNPKKTRTHRKVQQITDFQAGDLEKGSQVDLSLFEVGDSVTVRGTSKGKGFQGQVRRHNFRVARRTHGTKDPRHGSTNNTSITARQQKGLKMAGRMGDDTVTIHNCDVVAIDMGRNVIAVKGPVPGAKKGFVSLTKNA